MIRRPDQKGMALLVALSVITVLVALTLSLYQKMSTAFDNSLSSRHGETLSLMASSGIHLGMAMLVKDKVASKADSLQEDWADPEKISEAMEVLAFDEGNVSLVITDERNKIQVNALVALPGHDMNPPQFQLWLRLLQALQDQFEPLENMDAMEVINSLKDWIDSGDDDAITGLSGAESSYYTDLDPPYDCRNAPLNSLGDFSRIKGVPKELFSMEEGTFKISDMLTVHGMASSETGGYGFDEKININTAGVAVLTALLPEEYQIFAPEMVEYRMEKTDETFVNDLSSPTWYTNIAGMEDLTLDSALVTVGSNIFRITATAVLDNDSITTEAVVLRKKVAKTGKWHCKILYWQNK